MGTSVLPINPPCHSSGCPHSASAVRHPRIQAAGCAASFYISEHSQSLVSAGGSWNQPPSYTGGNCILQFSLSLKLFPNKQFILNALPHVRKVLLAGFLRAASRRQSTSRTARLPTIKPLSLEPGAAPLPPLVSWETQR